MSKLFGALDHDVELKREDHVTIVHGINGVGKTKLLELTAALTRGQIWRLLEVQFSKLRVEFDDGTATEVSRIASNGEPQRKKKSQQAHASAKIEAKRTRIATSELIAEWSAESVSEELERAHARLGLPPWIAQIADGRWLDTHTNQVMSWQTVTRRYGVDPRGMRQMEPSPEKVADLVPCSQAHLIETQRLLRIGGRRGLPVAIDEEDAPLTMTVHELAAELKQRISVVQSEFFRKTQALDRTLTERVLQANVGDEQLGENLRLRLEALAAHRGRLERVGLLDSRTFGPTLAPAAAGELRGDRAVMIAVHTDDAEKKFEVLDSLATRLELLLESMNEKLAWPKMLILDPEQQLTVKRNKEAIALEQLSSGEQHELVLLYDLAFRIQPKTLVLIDEPELSLHPLWQQQFLDDILKIAKNGDFDVLIATHSPYIIGNRNDLCVELKPERRP